MGNTREVETRVTCLCDDQMMMRLVSYLLVLAAALACFGLVADAQQGGYTVESVRVQVFFIMLVVSVGVARRTTLQLTSQLHFCRECKHCLIICVVLV